MRSKYWNIFFLLLNVSVAFSQHFGKQTLEAADEHFDKSNFIMAIPIYKEELRREPTNRSIRYKLGICYLKTKINWQEAVRHLEQYTAGPKAEDEAWLHLGKAYMLTNKLDEAISAFQKFRTLKSKKSEEVDRYIEQCHNAIKFINEPKNVTFQNLGKEINSDDPDYYPFVTGDETFMAFTSRRKDGIGGKKVEVDGYHPSDIYFSKVVNGRWTKAENAGRNINSSLDEQAVGLKADGLEMYVYLDHIDKFGDLYISSRKDRDADFSKSKKCDALVNAKIETSGCLSEDGRTFFFARREKVNSASDLYICRKLPNGKWALPQKLPETINSKYNEDFPYLSSDGITLYFASEGHNSMGGYDLFKTTWDIENNTFSTPENLGYPVNSTDDDRNICVTPDNRVAYISAFRPGGFGDLDIYRIRFNENEQISRLYTGKVYLGDSTTSSQTKNHNVLITVTNKKDKSEYFFAPNSVSGKFVMNLPVGKYRVKVTAPGYDDYTEDLIVSDIGQTDLHKNQNYLLSKKK
jgi:hypothetical protein